MAPVAISEKQKKKKEQLLTPEQKFQRSLATLSRCNDLAGALELYRTSPPPRGLSPQHFNTLLHLCASAPDPSAAAPAASAILQHMLASGFPPSEASLASAARVAAAGDGGGDRAFHLVKETAEKYGLGLKLRTCSPVLLAYCGAAGDADKAYEVESYMVEKGVGLEEAEIRGLLRASAAVGRGEKVYEYLHKLRGRGGCVEHETAEVIERWFGSEAAGEVGRAEWDEGSARERVAWNGGGWHGEGWLGKGSWKVGRVTIGGDGRCCGCGEVLKGVDIGSEEAENFAGAIATLATERETASNFKEFQEWLDTNNAYEAIVDGANVGLYQQNFADGGFSLTQLEAVVKELQEKCRGKWPLVILHNKRLQLLMKNSSLKGTLENWLDQGILYPTPKGSNDDWYWLYAAVKLKCLLLTNDEMRDHIFELLGNKFVPMWKEQHQVRYTFLKGTLKFEMPPAYSVVIQESESGSWHVPLMDSCEDEQSRTWLCITRRPLCRTFSETIQATDTSNGFTKLDRIQTEDGSSLGTISPSADDALPTPSTLGKRKDRSSSP